ncbi:MAG: AmmeMemoRadiSam system protein A [Bacteroidales bacterium]|nr:AmmeMemoRadiSam system protein A [Bacteroidales bacterium]
MTLTETDKRSLLKLARQTITGKLTPGKAPDNPDPETSDTLQLRCGAFVSVYINGKLRGCIGTFSEEETLYGNVKNMALSASTSDSRFNPIEPEELDDLTIEISVLSPRKLIFDKREIILGKHGIYLIKGLNRGTLLPQVATDQNWSVDEFLGNCASHKAGIGWDGWRTADLFTYEAIVFSSEEIDSNC